MELTFKTIEQSDLHAAAAVWNEVVEEGKSFPGDKPLNDAEAWEMFCGQTQSVCAYQNGELVGVYILHPNNIGRCGHIANASYAVKREYRGQGIGRKLVEHCIARAKECGFRALQFNAVVASNTAAIALYLKLGFTVIGTIHHGYRLKDGAYCDTLIFLKTWD